MSTLKMFCSREELIEWVRLFCRERRLGVLLFESPDSAGTFVRSPAELELPGSIRLPSFLFPLPGPERALMYDDVRPLEWGWMTLHAGGEQQAAGGPVLLYSELHAPAEAAAHLQWLKRRVRQSLQAGVVGRNDKLSGEAVYRDLWHSEKARRMHHAGTVWRQFRDGFVSFAPTSSK